MLVSHVRGMSSYSSDTRFGCVVFCVLLMGVSFVLLPVFFTIHGYKRSGPISIADNIYTGKDGEVCFNILVIHFGLIILQLNVSFLFYMFIL
jgi:hypothetical protein